MDNNFQEIASIRKDIICINEMINNNIEIRNILCAMTYNRDSITLAKINEISAKIVAKNKEIYELERLYKEKVESITELLGQLLKDFHVEPPLK
jgi:hypothetical protein